MLKIIFSLSTLQFAKMDGTAYIVFMLIFVTIQSVIFVLGFIGNGLVTFIILFDKKLRSVASFQYIASVSIGDLLSSLVIPIKIFRVFTKIFVCRFLILCVYIFAG